MGELTGQALLEYIRRVRDLEASCYRQNRYIRHLNALLEDATRPQFYALESQKKVDSGFGAIVGISMGICGLIGIPFGIKESVRETGILNGLIEGPIFGFLKGGAVGIVLGIIIGLIVHTVEKGKIKRKNATISAENAWRDEKNKQIMNESGRRVAMIRAEIDKAKRTFNSTKEVLDKYYASGVVYAKYRGLVPVTMFCEYLESGRCASLGGHEGAYNIYETEIRLNLILTKLDDIIQRLDQIQQNQNMLAQLIRQNNRQIQTLSGAVAQQANTLQSIERSTAVSAYYNEITATNTAYLSWIATKSYSRLY